MKRFCKCFAILCLAFLVMVNTLVAYAEQRITGCGFVDDDDCFAGGEQTTDKTWRGQHFAPGTTQLTYSKEKGESHELEANG